MLYAAFVALDLVSLFPRMAGSLIKKNGIGYSFQVMTATFRRVFIVIYPPLLGFISIDGSLNTLFQVVLISYGTAVFSLIAIFLLKNRILSFFCASLDEFSENGKLSRAFAVGFRDAYKWADVAQGVFLDKSRPSSEKITFDKTIVLTAAWIYFFYSSSPFLINVLGLKFSEYSNIILQLTGLSNAIGTIALAFFLDPKLSRIYEQQSDLPVASRSLFLAHVISLCVVGPIFFFALSIIMA
jgi:hypothetical protein